MNREGVLMTIPPSDAAEQRAAEAEQRARAAEQRAQSAERLVTASERRAQAEEHWALAAGQRAELAERLAATAKEAAQAAEQRASVAEQRLLFAEQRATAIEQRAAAIEQQVAMAERRVEAPTAAALPTSDDARVQQRIDLVRRFIAVAISVGFATQLVSMAWLANGTWPSVYEAEHLARLVAALFIVVVGWDWYSRDVGKPGFALFIVDILVVVASLLFLFAARHETEWLSFLVAIFALYVVWDGLGIWELRNARSDEDKETRELRRKALPVNAAWLVFFLALAGIAWWFPSPVQGRALVLSLAAVLAVYVLWLRGYYARSDARPGSLSRWTVTRWRPALLGIVALGALTAYLDTDWVAPVAPGLVVTEAERTPDAVVVAGRTPRPFERVSIGAAQQESDVEGAFRFALRDAPDDCMIDLRRGEETRRVFIRYCLPRSQERGPPGEPGRAGVKGDRGEPGPPGDAIFADAKAGGVKLCGLHSGGRVIRSEHRSFTFGGEFSEVVAVPKAWPGDACIGLFAGASPDVRLGCMFPEQPFVTWGIAASTPPEVRNCGW